MAYNKTEHSHERQCSPEPELPSPGNLFKALILGDSPEPLSHQHEDLLSISVQIGLKFENFIEVGKYCRNK